MNKNKQNVYLASGWFTPVTTYILENLEAQLDRREDINLYSPRRDGVMLPPNQRHDTALREKVFNDNIEHIKKADFVVANIHSTDSYNDTGTIYEIGYAVANGVPVIGFALSPENIDERFKGIMSGFEAIFLNYEELHAYLTLRPTLIGEIDHSDEHKVLFVGNGDEKVEEKLVSQIMEDGFDTRCLKTNHKGVHSRINDIFKGVDFMVAVIDDRSVLVSWMIGQAFARGIPVVTYSDHNYMINVMLLASVRNHIRGVEELNAFLQRVKREGLESIPRVDISDFESC